MATSKKALHEEIRNRYLKMVSDFLTENGEECLRTNSNEYAIPCVDSEGNEEFLVLTFKVPTGSRDGDPYDGYGEAESFEMKCKEKAEKAEKAKKEKEAKIEKDRKMREAKAKAKAERAEKGE